MPNKEKLTNSDAGEFLATDFGDLYKILSGAKRVALTMHIRPDGDSIGTACALKIALLGMGVETVDIWSSGSVHEKFNYIKFATDIIDSEIVFSEGTEQLKPKYDLLVVLDAGETHRIGASANLVRYSGKVIIFDHHIKPTMPCDLLVNNTYRASTGEMLFEFLTANKIEITKEMAEALYTAAASDTGCFLFANTTEYTFHVAGTLLATGIDAARINYINFREYDPAVIPGFVKLLKRLRFLSNGRVSVTSLTKGMVKKYNFTSEERHSIQKYASDAKGVRASIFATGQPDGSHNISLRSHGDVDVAAVARVFGGGGHRNASGMRWTGKFKDVVEQLVKEFEKEFDRVDGTDTVGSGK